MTDSQKAAQNPELAEILAREKRMESLFMRLSETLDSLPEERRAIFLAKLCLLLADRLEDHAKFDDLLALAAENPRRTS